MAIPGDTRSGFGFQPPKKTAAKPTTKSAPQGPPAPATPAGYQLTSPAALAALAGDQAHEQITAEQQPVLQQQKYAQQQADRDVSALGGINTAAASALRSIAPSIEGAYSRASEAVGQLGQGFSGALRDRVQGVNDRAGQLAAEQGIAPPSGAVLGPDANAMGDVAYGLGGYVPGTALAQQAAATAAYGAGLEGSNASAGRIAVQERQAQLADDNQKFRDQLSAIVAKYPQLEQAAQTALQNYEIKVAAEQRAEQSAADLQDYRDKSLKATRDYHNATLGETHDYHAATIGETRRYHDATTDYRWSDLTSRDAHYRATEDLTRDALGISAGHLSLDEKSLVQRVAYDVASLGIREKELTISAAKAYAEGRQLDKNLSIVMGHAVDHSGRIIAGTDGNPITVTKATFSTAAPKTPKMTAAKNFQSAVSDAHTLRGNPVKNPNTALGGGAYVAAPGAKGKDILPGNPQLGLPTTTNNPKLAQYDTEMSFAEAVGYLSQRRNISRAKARKALIAAGWKPDGVRPKPAPSGPSTLPIQALFPGVGAIGG